MDTLFADLPESLSPREAFCRRHKIRRVMDYPNALDSWTAYLGGESFAPCRSGSTEWEAVARLASAYNLDGHMEINFGLE